MSCGTHTHEPCGVGIIHVVHMHREGITRETLLSAVNVSYYTRAGCVFHMSTSRHVCARVMSPTWMCHATRAYESVVSQKWMGHVNASCHAYERVMARVWMSHVVRVNESCYASERVMSRIWKTYITNINEACHAYERVMSRIWVSKATHLNETWLACEQAILHVRTSHVTHMTKS